MLLSGGEWAPGGPEEGSLESLLPALAGQIAASSRGKVPLHLLGPG